MNHLIHETSPYLLQHAHNPVEWFPWSEQALKKAKAEHKPILVSIGYSSCHWCHVMEHQSFEKQDVAELMNTHFVCIKIDREERPDLDNIYMEAVQLMGINGGWPLNVFLTEDLQPFYGGTYFPKDRWMSVLQHIGAVYKEKKGEVYQSAKNITNALNEDVFKRISTPTDKAFSKELFTKFSLPFLNGFDIEYGGFGNAPKFPMPTNYDFLLTYYHFKPDPAILKIITKGLDAMAMGGIYDQLGGGFSRYSTDEQWLAPHFEKMLYDNAQLLSTYSKAYQLNKSSLYKEVIRHTIDWFKREMYSEEGGYFSALDADSEGEEGKFYVWGYEELVRLIPEKDFPLFCDYYYINYEGNWEQVNILHRSEPDLVWLQKYHLSQEELEIKKQQWHAVLMAERNTRIRPGLDDKLLLSWNALALKGFCDAYKALQQPHLLKEALSLAHFIETAFTKRDDLVHHYKNGHQGIPAFCDDYAMLIQAYIELYQISFDEQWITRALALNSKATELFFDPIDGFYFYSRPNAELIAQKKELYDNVIPAANSTMALNNQLLGTFFDDETMKNRAENMVNRIAGVIQNQPKYMSNWALAYTHLLYPIAEIVISSTEPTKAMLALETTWIPNKLYIDANSISPLATDKYLINKETNYFVCFDKTCKLPTTDPEKVKNLVLERN